ncbi:MAG: 50S ribosomal protein L6, partial [Candidatus Peribacteraceae bacterium]
MSRIGKKPVALPAGVTVEVKGSLVHVQGSKGAEELTLLPEITVTVQEGQILVERRDDTEQSRARHGLMRQLIANMVTGVSNGFEKRLEIIGVGYKAQVKGKTLA